MPRWLSVHYLRKVRFLEKTFIQHGFDILRYAEIDSTNEEARRLLRAGRTDDFVVLAEQQTSGRGREGRQWESPKGNMFASLVLHTNKPLYETAQISFVAALALGEMLSAMLRNGNDVLYKWPNDVLVKGKKIAGILLESSMKAGDASPGVIIVGIGLNIASCPENVRFPATYLHSFVNDGVSVSDCLQMLLGSFTQWYRLWQIEGLEPIRSAWLAKAWGKGSPLKVDLGKIQYQGVFGGMTGQGELILKERSGNIRHITSGEIFFGDI